MPDEHSRSQDYNSLKIEIELVKKDISFINTLIERLDMFMTKIQDQHDAISEKTNIMIESKVKLTTDDLSELCLALDKTKDLLSNRIFSLEKSISDDISIVKSDLTDHILSENSLINRYNKIIYGAGACIALIVWGFNNTDFIKFLLK